MAFPYVFADTTYAKARVEHQVVPRAVVIATGLTAKGGREVLGIDVADSAGAVFWTAFFANLEGRGLDGAELVISHAPRGLSETIRETMKGPA